MKGIGEAIGRGRGRAAVACLGLAAWGALALAARAGAPTFEDDIGPIFKARCTKCHGFLLPQKGLRLTSLKNVLKGGESGPAVVPGKPEASLLYRQFSLPVTDPRRMPPAAENNELTAAERAAILAWIAAGAK